MRRAAFTLMLLAAPCLADEPPPTGSSLPVGDAPAPATVRDNLADGIYGVAPMERARATLAEEHGGAVASKVMANLFELTSAADGGGYRWDAEAWYGGDRHRFVFRTEGAGLRRGPLEDADAQALYSRAVGRYTDVQAGVRYELEPDGRTYATVALESLLPYWFKVQAALFVSDRGDVFSRLEGQHDLRLTQRWILQPRVEILLAAQDVPDVDVAAGLSSLDLGLRLRYEIHRELAPYVGVSYDRHHGLSTDTADTAWVLGVRGWL